MYYIFVLALVSFIGLAGAEDLYDGTKQRSLNPGTSISSDSTIGGYPIYHGDKKWRFSSASTTNPNQFGVSYGTVVLLSPENSKFFTQMTVTTNLNQSSKGFYFTNNPCEGEHLIKVYSTSPQGGEGTSDDCMTVNPYLATVGGKSITTLRLFISNRQSQSRNYTMTILVDPEVLGMGSTTVSDWSKDSIAANTQRTQFFEKISSWAKKMHSAVQTAIGYSKPADSFKNVPSLMELRLFSDNQKISQTIRSNNQVTPTLPGQAKENDIDSRLSELKRIFDKDLITKDDYESKKKKILDSL